MLGKENLVKRAIIVGLVVAGGMGVAERVGGRMSSAEAAQLPKEAGTKIFLPSIAKGTVRCSLDPRCQEPSLEEFQWLSSRNQTECCHEAPPPFLDGTHVQIICRPNPNESSDEPGDEFECRWSIHAGDSNQATTK